MRIPSLDDRQTPTGNNSSRRSSTAKPLAMARQELDFVAELRLRQWARANHVPAELRRDSDWHPVVLDEMRRKDADMAEQQSHRALPSGVDIVPLMPDIDGIRIDLPHAAIPTPKLMRTVTEEPIASIEYYT